MGHTYEQILGMIDVLSDEGINVTNAKSSLLDMLEYYRNNNETDIAIDVIKPKLIQRFNNNKINRKHLYNRIELLVIADADGNDVEDQLIELHESYGKAQVSAVWKKVYFNMVDNGY